MKLRNAPYWGFIALVTIFSPVGKYLIEHQKWPYNENGPLHKHDQQRGLV